MPDWPGRASPRRSCAATKRKNCRRERALKRWAEQVVRDPKQATANQIDDLTTAVLSDLEIFEATVYIAFRLAFPTINDALDARPDHQLVAATLPAVKAAVKYGREPA